MDHDILNITVEATNKGEANSSAQDLADKLREVEGVLEATRQKESPSAMDLGTIVQVIATSGATSVIAHGIAAWLQARRNVKLRIERDSKSGKITTEVERVNPEAATRIVELVVKTRSGLS